MTKKQKRNHVSARLSEALVPSAAARVRDEVATFDDATIARFEDLFAQILPLEQFAKEVHISLVGVPPSRVRALRAGERYLRNVQGGGGGVIKAAAPCDGLLVRGHDEAETFISVAEVLQALGVYRSGQ